MVCADKLHEPYRWGLIKGGLEVREAAKAAETLMYCSGDGPSILCLCKRLKAETSVSQWSKTWETAGVASHCPLMSLQLPRKNAFQTPFG